MTPTTLALVALKTQQTPDSASAMPQIILMTPTKDALTLTGKEMGCVMMKITMGDVILMVGTAVVKMLTQIFAPYANV
jgi:hypothetical protein